MKIIREVIEFEEVVDEFMDVGETIDDLSLIRLSLIKDTHDDSFELSIEIFGAGDPDVEGPVLEFNFDPDAILKEDALYQGINSQTIPTLFDSDLLDTLIDSNTQIVWNQDDETKATINLTHPGTDILLPMLR
jgi:hypothetical protein